MSIILHATVGSTDIDPSGNVFGWEDLKRAFEHCTNAPLPVFIDHVGAPVGQVLRSWPNEVQKTVEALLRIDREDAITKVRTGALWACSPKASADAVGGPGLAARTNVRLIEISLVDDPGFSKCRIHSWTDPATGSNSRDYAKFAGRLAGTDRPHARSVASGLQVHEVADVPRPFLPLSKTVHPARGRAGADLPPRTAQLALGELAEVGKRIDKILSTWPRRWR